MPKARKLALALSGGNALGAFQAGALAHFIRTGLEADFVAGTSIGAINAALLLGARDRDPEGSLRRFWQELAIDILALSREQQIEWAGLSSLIFGRPTVSRSHIGSLLAGQRTQNALQDQGPLAHTLERLIDFDKLSRSKTRLAVCAVGLEPDEPVIFDSESTRIETAHLLASSAIPVLFPPVVIDGRAHVDGGLSLNLPLEPVLALLEPPFDCIAVDLFGLGGRVPQSIGEAGERVQSLIFGLQSQRILRNVQVPGNSRLLHIPYRPGEPETAAKAFDYSRESIRTRWKEGELAMQRALADCESAKQKTERVG
ncbi:MAG: patatin-like phospholipase family protein [Hyphomicrobiales bacterium]|nr:patatin-like phospholipase family protein [Hyphomicrobiales bacterium]